MFSNLKGNCVKRFIIRLEDLLKPYWDILKEMYEDDLLLNIDFTDIDPSFNEKVRTISTIPPEEKEPLFNFAFSSLCKQYSEESLKNELLNTSSLELILLIVKEPIIVIQDTVPKKDSINEIKHLFRGQKILSNLIDKGDKKTGLLDCIKLLDDFNFYKPLVGEADDIDNLIIFCPFYPLSFIDTTNLKEVEHDIENIWINSDILKKNYNLDLNIQDNSLCKLLIKEKDDSNIDKAIGIIINDYVFVIKSDIDEYIKTDIKIDYYWYLFKHNVFKDSTKTKEVSIRSENINKFLDCCKQEEFSCLLSHLENNLYIKNKKIPSSYQEFFEPLIKFDEVSGIDNYELFVHDSKDDLIMLGAYNKARSTTDSSYNLKHLIEYKHPNINFWTKGTAPMTKPKKKLDVFRPEIAYFFIEYFYEEFLEKVLISLQNEHEGLEFVKNYHTSSLPNQEHEIDFIIKANNELFFIETKTKLNTHYINKYIKKCKQWIKDFEDVTTNLHFIIIGCYSNPELDIFRYSVKEDEVPAGYNMDRSDLNGIPYYFKVPIMNTSKSLTCFTEPSFEKLKQTMKTLLKL